MGRDTSKKKLGFNSPHFLVSYLGVSNGKDVTVAGKDGACNVTAKHSNRYTIVSCSNLIPLKRIDLIIHALSIVNTGKEIEWKHFGDGILRHELEKLAETDSFREDQFQFYGTLSEQ